MSLTRVLARALAAAALATLAACASAPPAAPGAAAVAAPAATNPVDPWENWNRKVYAFNDAIDTAVLKPVAQTYHDVVPHLVRQGIDNVLGNIRDAWSAANHLLQGKVEVGLEMGMRVLTNTFFGLGGLLDPATEMRLSKRPTDFGLTLGHWGIGTGPYLVLPFFGPSNIRDGIGLVADVYVGPSRLPPTATGRDTVTVVDTVNTRSNLLSAGALLDQVALDKYSFLRDAYLSRRRDAVYDGAPPMDSFEDDGADPVAAKPAAGSASAAAASASSAASAPAPAASAAAK